MVTDRVAGALLVRLCLYRKNKQCELNNQLLSFVFSVKLIHIIINQSVRRSEQSINALLYTLLYAEYLTLIYSYLASYHI